MSPELLIVLGSLLASFTLVREKTGPHGSLSSNIVVWFAGLLGVGFVESGCVMVSQSSGWPAAFFALGAAGVLVCAFQMLLSTAALLRRAR